MISMFFSFDSLEKLVDNFGYRFAGTENLENAIDYIIDQTKKNNLQDVHTENVTVYKSNNYLNILFYY